MVFSTLFFLTVFLPGTLLGAWCLAALCGFVARKRKVPMSWGPVNFFLLLASLFFYAWGEGLGVGWLLLSIAVNDGIARCIARSDNERLRKALVGIDVALNLVFLGYFKYAGFLVSSINALTHLGVPVPHIALPLGISFYTFQAMSYVIDVFRREAAPPRSPIDFACYVAMFPQLVAGPIVRYTDVAEALKARATPLSLVASGFRRFLCGLTKKVLIANSVAPMADSVWELAEAGHAMHHDLALLGLICYALQIYYDFSGYSDMAIGLGRMFGFHFPENFLHPYCASSIRDFWRRWHVSLSTWFRDYLYIPLGGSRCSRLRAGINGLIVFGLCGLWHGASIMFLLWGLWHGLFLLIERFLPKRDRSAPPRPRLVRIVRFALGHVYTLAVFLFGWILFRSESWTAVQTICLSLSGLLEPAPAARALWLDVTPRLQIALVFGLLFAYPLMPALRKRVQRLLPPALLALLENATLLILGFFAFLFLAGGSYNPFLYFRF